MTLTTKLEISAIAAALPPNLPTLEAYLPRPRDVAHHLQAGLHIRGYSLRIEWEWQGRNRDGVVSIFDRAQACVYSATYARAETRWDENDELLTSCNRGSSKHFALIAALAFMSKLPRRKCDGISDTLVP